MAWQSIAEWEARHSPQYITAVQKLQMQRQIAHEVEDRRASQQMETMRYQADMQAQRDQAREGAMLAVEQERGRNRIAEIREELDAKIRLMGVEAQIATFTRLLDEQGKNRDHFRELLTKRADFRAETQKAIIHALIAKKAGIDAHGQATERIRLEAEIRECKAEIDELARKAIAFGEIESKSHGEAAAAKTINDLVAKWELQTGSG
jgi:hypothetical protein